MVKLSQQQRLVRFLARRALSLPLPVQSRLAGPAVVMDGRTLDPQIQLMLRLQRRVGGKPWAELALRRSRRQLDVDAQFLVPAAPRLADVETIGVQGADGMIAARVYRPLALKGPAPALVFYHGGGFVLGSLGSHDIPCRLLAAGAGCVVLSVDYRLAPEHRFPSGRSDAVAAFRDIAQRAESLGLDPRRIAVAGDSAGGNLATAVALDTRDDARRPCHQLLIYPTVDATMSFPSITGYGSGFLLTKQSMDWFCDNYFEPAQDRSRPEASPINARLEGMPPTTLHTAGFDPLCDEGEAYAQRLREAGVRVEARCHEGLVHGYLSMSGVVRAARDAVDDLIDALRRALA